MPMELIPTAWLPTCTMVLWLKIAPIKDDSSNDSIGKFVDKYITCAIPDSKHNDKLHELLTTQGYHLCHQQ